VRTVEQMVEVYTDMGSRVSSVFMYEEVKWQYKDMAKGGDGGELGFESNGETTCRGINYKGYPDTFFKEVCYQMGWLDRPDVNTLEPYSADPV
tara:strand:- start:1524 stop:1802 length:279 start_codon:yes stop_codon:yes gene_type:complete